MRFLRGLLAGMLLAAGLAGGGAGRVVEAQSLGVVGETTRSGLDARPADYGPGADAASATGAGPPSEARIDEARIAEALVETLRIGIGTVVAKLGRAGGFTDDPAIRIPLPGGLASVRDGLVGAGLGPLVVDLESRMNRAAEAAMPEAGRVLGEALAALTLEDARAILEGPDDAATRFFEARMGPSLIDQMAPIVEVELREAGAIAAFDAFLAGYAALPLMPAMRGSPTRHVVDQALAGLFQHIAEEERAIRRDPEARSTTLLRGVFGGS